MAAGPDRPWKALSLVTLIGVDIAVLTVIGFWLGRRVDAWLETSPLWMIVGVFLGMACGIISIIPVVKKYLGD
ncbi:AtpZ/AtpI family protein [Bacillus horti]|uniref:F0F1-type ATP synthase assembly protein I n=1 Tax=Caldalkalibacillus horti TaxID=77523 RepID=A0ABT9VZR0_9BACI|nr:AtpZ/AtpI family protein [Bacillus horti]MDQ0166471.1 F0F1-type ATP synthase assembly protein I [Bacillus horti]